MLTIALKMLVGDRSRYFGIVMGITFSSLVITQQAAIFLGLMTRTFGFITDTSLPDIWVMDPNVQFVDDVKPLQDTQLFRVRGVSGIEWAVPLYKGILKARLPDGTFQSCNVIGLDDASLIGGPPEMLEGTLSDLRTSDGVIVDDVGAAQKLARPNPVAGGPPIPLKVGDTLELNDHRAVVVGIAKVSRTFQSQPVIYTTYTRATAFAPRERKLLSFIVAKAKAGVPIPELARRIEQGTGLKALDTAAFKELTYTYFLKYTGIPINFGIAVFLGLLVGTAIAGQTFYNFTLDNLRYFGALKAMGASNMALLRMILVQALLVGGIGFGLGTGAASGFYYLSKKSELAFFMPWQLIAVTGIAVLSICSVAAFLSILKVFRLEPAIVFRS